MHLVIISCTPRTVKASNTDKIVSKFRQGFEENGNTSELHYLVHRDKWGQIREAFYKNDEILFALPLFVECVPGIMLEFLETLEPKKYSEDQPRCKISFLLQGGFAEASQLRCGEAYLEMLPSYFNCDYNGTLIKGNMFAVSIVPDKARENMIAPFVEMGRLFAAEGRFDKAKSSEFAKPEYFSKGFILFSRLITPVQKLIFKNVAKSRGCDRPLDDRPYQQYIKALIEK